MLWSWLFSLAVSGVGVVVALVVVRRGPRPRLGPWSALRRQFAQYGTVGGRASRSEFWWPWLLYLLVSLLFETAALPLGRGLAHVVALLQAPVSAAAMLPGLAVASRRLHDTGRSAWWWLLVVTVVGIPWVLWWLSRPSQEGPNPWGPAPGTSSTLPEVPGEGRPWTATGPPQHGLLWSAVTLAGVLARGTGDVVTLWEAGVHRPPGWAVLCEMAGGLLLVVGIIGLRGAPLFGRPARA